MTSLDWVTYPILRFKDSPKVTTVVVQRTDAVADRLGGAGVGPGRRGDRERVLRRDGRPGAQPAADARPRAVAVLAAA